MDEDERERRCHMIEQARATCERLADVRVEEPDYLAMALARPIESVMDRDRREIAEAEAQRAATREAERRRKNETVPAAEVGAALEAAARGLAALAAENDTLREQITKLTKRIETLEQKPVDTLNGIDRGLARIDRLADKLSQTLQHSAKRRFDDLPLPLPAHLNN